jgi:hypothetical protein
MEMKKLMLFGSDTDAMDKVVHLLNTAFGVND